MKHPIRSLILVAALAVALNVTPAKAVLVSNGPPNVVGIINQAHVGGVGYLVGPPLSPSAYDLNTLLPSATTPVGTKVGRFYPSIGDFDCSTNTVSGWSSNIVFNVGEGFYLLPSADFTNAWYGEVREGNWTNTIITGGSLYSLVAPLFPLGGNLNTNIMQGWPKSGSSGDRMLPWNVEGQDWRTGFGFYYPSGARSNTWYLNYMIKPGESFLVRQGTNSTPDTTNWVSSFTVDGGTYGPANRSVGVWVSIANVSTTPSVPAVTTATITAHNTAAAVNYTLLCSASVGADQVWWPVYTFSGIDGDYSANITWTNSPNPDPAAWTNSNYGNVLATNVPYSNIGMPSIYFTVQDNPTTPRPMGSGSDKLEIHVKAGNTFTPVVNYTTNTPTKVTNVFGNDVYELTGADVWQLNLGWNGDDYAWWLQGGDLYDKSKILPGLGWPTNRYPSQPAHAFFNLGSCVNMTNFSACNFDLDPIQQPLDFSNLGKLRDIELFGSGAPGITLKGCTNLWRLCIESCNATGTLDLSDCTALQDLRGALNNRPTRTGYTNITWPAGSAKSNIVHICVRDNPQLSTNLMSSTLDNSFTGLRELLFWGDNQTGPLNLASSNLT